MAKGRTRRTSAEAQLVMPEERPGASLAAKSPAKPKRARGRPKKAALASLQSKGAAPRRVSTRANQVPGTAPPASASGPAPEPNGANSSRQEEPREHPSMPSKPPTQGLSSGTVLEDLPALVDNTVVSLMFKLEEARRLLDNSTDVTQIRYLMGMVTELAQAITTVKSIPL